MNSVTDSNFYENCKKSGIQFNDIENIGIKYMCDSNFAKYWNGHDFGDGTDANTQDFINKINKNDRAKFVIFLRDYLGEDPLKHMEKISEFMYANTQIGDLIIPDNIKSISGGAFYKSIIKTLNIPEVCAFDNNSLLEGSINNLVLNTKSLVLGKFNKCTNINEINCANGVDIISIAGKGNSLDMNNATRNVLQKLKNTKIKINTNINNIKFVDSEEVVNAIKEMLI